MDEIQQKIEEFQRSLESQSPLKDIIFNCPAVLPAIGLICGLIVQFYFEMPIILVLSFLGGLLILYFLFFRFLDFALKGSARNDILTLILVFLCFLCLGSIRLIKFNHPVANDIRRFIKDESTFAHIKGEIVSEPKIVDNNDWHFAKFYPSLAYTTFYAKIREIKTETGWINVNGKIKVYISDKTEKFKINDKFQTFCGFEKFVPADNPAQFDYKKYMNRNGIYFCASVKSAEAIKVYEQQNIKSGLGIKSKLNELATAWLNDYSTEDSEDAKLVEAMVLGSRTKIDRKLYNDFVNTGLVHLVCLSGLNVGIFAGVAWWISKKAGLLHRGRSIACIIATVIFMLVVPTQSATLRAAMMFIIFCIARLFNRQANLLNCIAISMILILLIYPLDFLSPSFQLSFLATIGIVLFCPVFYTFLIAPLVNFKKNIVYKTLTTLLAAFSTGCTAWLFVSPITAYHFYQTQLLTALWTVPAMIPATILIVLGTLKILLYPFLPSAAYCLGFVVDYSAKTLIYLVTIFSQVPFANIKIGKPSIIIVLILYLLFFLWKFLPLKTLQGKFLYPCIVVFVFLPLFFWNKVENRNSLNLTILSVGHGQCCVLSCGSENIIIDAGSITKSDIGDKIINPYLDYSAIKKIDAVYISHDDIDHFNGLPEITNKHIVNIFFTTPQLVESDSNTAMELKKLYPLTTAPEKLVCGKAQITRLWPKEMSVDFSDNESSLVLLTEYNRRKILFCSDITADVQQQLMKVYTQLDIDVLITPHHGSARTTNKDFVNYFKPEYIITSSSDRAISPIIREKKNSYYTFRDGAINVTIDVKGRINVNALKRLK